jgi:hypothetical protein
VPHMGGRAISRAHKLMSQAASLTPLGPNISVDASSTLSISNELQLLGSTALDGLCMCQRVWCQGILSMVKEKQGAA